VTGTVVGAPSLAGSAARGSLVTLLGQSVRIGTQFASIFVLARVLDSVDYGYLAMVLAVIGIAELLRDFGLSAAAVQARALSQAQQSNLFWLNSLIGLVAALGVLAAAPLIARLYGEPALTTITMSLAPVFLLNGLATQFRADINRKMRFLALSVADVVPQVLAFSVAIGVALSVRSYWALVAQQMTVSATGLVMSVVLSRWRPSRPRRGVTLRSQLRFGSSLFATHLMTYVVNNSQTVMIGATYGAVVVGYFSRAYQLMALPLTQIVAPLTKVALPVLARVNDDRPRYAKIVGRAQLLGLYLTAPVFLLCFTLAGPLIRVALGDEWSSSITIFAVLALGGAFRAMSQLAFWVFLSSGNTRAQLRFNAVAYPVLVLLMLAGLPWRGVGVAVAHTVGYALYWPLSLWFACRAAGVGFRPLARAAVRVCVVVGLGIVLVSGAVCRLGWPDLVTLVAATAASLAYVGLTMVVLPAGRSDFRILHEFVRGTRR